MSSSKSSSSSHSHNSNNNNNNNNNSNNKSSSSSSSSSSSLEAIQNSIDAATKIASTIGPGFDIYKAACAGQQSLSSMLNNNKYNRNIHSKDADQWTALHCAAYFANLHAVSLLMKHGALAKIKDDEGATPLHLAAGHLESPNTGQERAAIVKFLLNNNASINSVDNYGRTPLMRAILGNNHETLAVLLASSATIKQKDIFGYTAIDLCLLPTTPEHIRNLVRSKHPNAFPAVTPAATPATTSSSSSSSSSTSSTAPSAAATSTATTTTPATSTASATTIGATKNATSSNTNNNTNNTNNAKLKQSQQQQQSQQKQQQKQQTPSNAPLPAAASTATPTPSPVDAKTAAAIESFYSNCKEYMEYEMYGRVVYEYMTLQTPAIPFPFSNINVADNDNGYNGLHYAVVLAPAPRKVEVIANLIENGIIVGSTNSRKANALHLLAMQTIQQGPTDLHAACALEIIKAFPKIVDIGDENGFTPMMYAASLDNVFLVSVLFIKGASLTLTEELKKFIPSHLVAVAQALLHKAAHLKEVFFEVNKVDDFGHDTFILAIMREFASRSSNRFKITFAKTPLSSFSSSTSSSSSSSSSSTNVVRIQSLDALPYSLPVGTVIEPPAGTTPEEYIEYIHNERVAAEKRLKTLQSQLELKKKEYDRIRSALNKASANKKDFQKDVNSIRNIDVRSPEQVGALFQIVFKARSHLQELKETHNSIFY